MGFVECLMVCMLHMENMLPHHLKILNNTTPCKPLVLQNKILIVKKIIFISIEIERILVKSMKLVV
jgi:ferritin-like protein